jgi:hypothetical protein
MLDEPRTFDFFPEMLLDSLVGKDPPPQEAGLTVSISHGKWDVDCMKEHASDVRFGSTD